MIRVFPARNKWIPTDELSFVGDPTLFRPKDSNIPVHISITFTWDKKEGERLKSSWSRYYNNVYIGGPAYDDPGNEFFPNRYIKQGVVITSRGCPKNCPWCFVPKREGNIRELEIKPGWVIQDNNLLACSDNHITAVFDMLRKQNRNCYFNGGIDLSYLNEWHIELFQSIKLGELWFACDTQKHLRKLEQATMILESFPINKKRCYVLIGFGNEHIEDAEKRLENIYALGYLPFAQLYKNENNIQWSNEWRLLARKWSRPAAYRSKSLLQGR